jgi:AI-2 transport protein TqsA
MARSDAPGPIGREVRILRAPLLVIALVTLVWFLRQIAPVGVPLIAAAFVALLVAPVDRWVAERAPDKLRWLGHVAAMMLILVVTALFIEGIWIASEQVVSHFASSSGTGSGTGRPSDSGGILSQVRHIVGSGISDLFGGIAGTASGIATTVLSSAVALLSGVVFIFFLTLLMLIEAPRWRAKLAALLEGSDAEWFATLDLIARRLRRYLLLRTVLGMLTALLYVGWLALFGIDLLVVWGILALLLNFVPTLGSLVAGILPVLFAFIQKDPGTAAIVGAGIFAIEQAMGNFVDPRVQGDQLSVSPLVVLVSLAFWGWVWGIPGAVLAVPITIAMIVAFAHISALRHVALLLSNESDVAGLKAVTSNEAPR